MYCKYCGKQIPETAKFCNGCGAKTEIINYQQPMPSMINNNGINYIHNTNNKQNGGNPIVLLACIVFGIFAIVLPLFLTSTSSNSATDSSKSIEDKTTMNIIEYKGYVFYIPQKYNSMFDDSNNLEVTNTNQDFLIMFNIGKSSYSWYKKYQDYLIQSLEEEGMTDVTSDVRTYQGEEYIFFKMTYMGIESYLIVSQGHDDEAILSYLYVSNPKLTYNDVLDINFELLGYVE